MVITAGQTSTGRTSTEENNTKHIAITRKKQLFLLFWVAEEDKGKNFFSESAQTRLINLKTLEGFDNNIQKVHNPPLHGFAEIQKIIDYWVNHYGGKNKVEVREVSFFSHAAPDGPIIYQAQTTTPLTMLVDDTYKVQMKDEYWRSINFYWASSGRLNFFGCNTANPLSNKNFSELFSTYENCHNIIIGGQPYFSFPSFYPDTRATSVLRSANMGWNYGATYMVAGKSGDGKNALQGKGTAKKMIFYQNGKKIYEEYQSLFNDHRKNRSTGESKEHRELKTWDRREYSQ